ncbi:BLUF domain-containing protein [Hymenobacter siberiensis]|uniref:BLUF domain-containing protein n=1 Tax=Hymenobacter siberiensis TaxID=2848396 RepID=UPI001C1E2B94|nr:BLUF domain-containing protein [Hymenobacter siberiensis]MBU6122639.1 BLUF domain-containing protein [Hymenobacter siberiensis]
MRTYHLIYQSQAMVPFNAPELRALHRQAQAYNGTHGITGVLLHTADGRFLQLLEGTEAAVRHLYYNHIVRDPRHRDCHILAEGPCLKPSFASWAMVLRFVRPNEVRDLLAHVPADGNQARCVPRARTGPELAAALRGFIATGQAAQRT